MWLFREAMKSTDVYGLAAMMSLLFSENTLKDFRCPKAVGKYSEYTPGETSSQKVAPK